LIGMPGPIEEYADVTGNTPAHRREILRAV
jgi:hypothetical protein